VSAPVVKEDIVAAATKFLKTKTDIVALLGSSEGQPWLTQYRLWHEFEGSQATAVVIDHDGGWAGPNLHNTLRFPRLLVSVWGDPRRDMGNNAVDYGEVRRRVNAAYEVIDSYLHRANGTEQMWSTIRTVSCVRLTEPVVYTVPEGDGIVRLQVYYAITQG
jgi:hypothetical protein